jgi:non-specific serine/threonine protein kinase
MGTVESQGPAARGWPDLMEIDPKTREMRVDGCAVPLSSRAFEVLRTLVEASGAIVPKSDLMSRVWSDTIVSDTALQVQISAIRKALGANRALLSTASGRGYRLLGEWQLREGERSIAFGPLQDEATFADYLTLDSKKRSVAGARTPIYRSDDCEIDLSLRQVRIGGDVVPIGGRAFDILSILVQANNEVISKSTLLELVWSGVVVGDTAIDVHISAIRKALGSYRGLLKTVSGRGFRLLGEWTVQSAKGLATPLVRAGNALPTNLPAPANNLVGRGHQIEFLGETCSAYRVVTLTGAGGIGKTALAIALARGLLPRFDGGVWLVELASLADPSLVPLAVGEALGLHVNGRPMSAEGVARVIGQDRILLVLDNCEHLIGAAAEMADAIIRLAPNAVVLATSRETLRVNGERVYRVPALEVPQDEAVLPDAIVSSSAVQMFLGLIEAPGTVDLRDETLLRSIAVICRRLDGLPLAIEFAAARSASLGIARVAHGLEDRFALLTSGRRMALPRHRTLRAVFDWSYALLPDSERSLLHRLAIFAGGFTFDAVCRVMDQRSSLEVADSISSLVEKSIVTLDRGASGERWRLLETVRAYAMDKLIESGEFASVARSHAEHFRDVFSGYDSRLNADPESGAAGLPAISREIDNLRSALTWAFSHSGDRSLGIALTVASVPFWLAESLLVECRKWTTASLAELGSAVNTRQEMVLRSGLGQSLMFAEGMTAATYSNLTLALNLAEAHGSVEYQKRALHSLWQISLRSLDLQKASQISRRYSQLALSENDVAAARMAKLMAGMSLVYQAEYVEASRLLEEAYQEHSDVQLRKDAPSLGINARAAALGHLSPCLFARGLIDAAIRAADRSIEEAEQVGQPVALCLALARPAGLLLPEVGALEKAERHIAVMQERVDRYGFPTFRAVVLCAKGRILFMRGDPVGGAAALRAGLAQFEATGYRSFIPPFQGYFAEALAGAGDIDEGIAQAGAAVRFAQDANYVEYVPELQCIEAKLVSLRSPDNPASERIFLHAIELSRHEKALYWELCAALGLSRLWELQGRHKEANALLEPIYRRFTEGKWAPALQRASLMLHAYQKLM